MDQEQKSPTEHCPRCREKGEIRKLIHIYYSKAQAFYTCENRECIYFVTDGQGNPTKFQLDTNLKRLAPISTPVMDDHSLAKQISSLPQDFTASQNANESFSSSNTINPKDVILNNSQIYIAPSYTNPSLSLPRNVIDNNSQIARNMDASFSLSNTINSSNVILNNTPTDITFDDPYKLENDITFWSDLAI